MGKTVGVLELNWVALVGTNVRKRVGARVRAFGACVGDRVGFRVGESVGELVVGGRVGNTVGVFELNCDLFVGVNVGK